MCAWPLGGHPCLRLYVSGRALSKESYKRNLKFKFPTGWTDPSVLPVREANRITTLRPTISSTHTTHFFRYTHKHVSRLSYHAQSRQAHHERRRAREAVARPRPAVSARCTRIRLAGLKLQSSVETHGASLRENSSTHRAGEDGRFQWQLGQHQTGPLWSKL